MELPSQQDFDNFFTSRVNELNSLYTQIIDQNNINAVMNNIPGAAQNDTARKNRVRDITNELNNYYSSLGITVDAIEREQSSITTAVNAEKQKLDSYRNDMREKRELADLRKEQAADVRQKYSADYHSSVLGLWRPLHPNTRGVLYTVSTMLMLISVAAVGYLVMTSKTKIIPAIPSLTSGSGPVRETSLFNDSNNFGRVGGAMKLRPKK